MMGKLLLQSNIVDRYLGMLHPAPTPPDEFGCSLFSVGVPYYICRDCGFANSLDRIEVGSCGLYLECNGCRAVAKLKSGVENKHAGFILGRVRTDG